MAKTLGCQDVGFECPWRVTAEEGQEEVMVAATIEHAKLSHPELTEDLPQLTSTLQGHISNLYEQAGFSSSEDASESAR